MKLIPYEKFCIISPYPSNEVQYKLEQVIDRPDYYPLTRRILGQPDPVFIGKISNVNFNTRREITGRNSFLPMIKGSIVPYLTGSKIFIRFRMHPSIIVLTVALCGFIGITSIKNIIRNNNLSFVDYTIPFVMILFALTLAIVEYNKESEKARCSLLEITNGEIATDCNKNKV